MPIRHDDHEFRRICAELTVLRALLEATLATLLDAWPEEARSEALEAFSQIGGRIDARSETAEEAEISADISVLAQERLIEILRRVAVRTKTDWAPQDNPLLGSLLRKP